MAVDPSVEISISAASTSDGVDELDELGVVPPHALEAVMQLPSATNEVQSPPSTFANQSPAQRNISEPPPTSLSGTVENSELPPQASTSKDVGGRPSKEAKTLTEIFYSSLAEQVTDFSRLVDCQEEKVLDGFGSFRSELLGKPTTTSKDHHWNIYQQYHQAHLPAERAQVSDIPVDAKGFIPKCYKEFKLAMGDNYRKVLTNFAELHQLENPKTEGELKKGINKFVKNIQDLVSGIVEAL